MRQTGTRRETSSESKRGKERETGRVRDREGETGRKRNMKCCMKIERQAHKKR